MNGARRRSRLRAGVGDERGSVAAEFAVALPAIMLVLLLGVGTLGALAQQVRLQDAAADAARLASRGEADYRVEEAAEAAGAMGAAIEHRADLVCVTTSGFAPGRLGRVLQASSCALAGGR